jgi:hypothetical protein
MTIRSLINKAADAGAKFAVGGWGLRDVLIVS